MIRSTSFLESSSPCCFLNGRYDPISRLNQNQLPRLELLGTPEPHKKHVLFDSLHGGRLSHAEIREILDWLDRYLGPVNLTEASLGGATSVT